MSDIDFSTSALNRVGVHLHSPAALPPERDLILIVQETIWAPGLVSLVSRREKSCTLLVQTAAFLLHFLCHLGAQTEWQHYRISFFHGLFFDDLGS